MMKLLLFTALAFAEEAHQAAAVGGHDAHAIPWSSIFVQAFNFGLLLVVLFFLLRKSVAAHFENRAKEYAQLVERAEMARKQAEKSHSEIKERLAKLESTAEQSVRTAQTEAEELKGRMITEAKSISDKLEAEAKRSVAVELDKAKAELRRELLARALDASRDSFKKNLGSTEQKKLQNEFVEKIQVVGG
jgi:F-type H+-transporting ATPase subunit b